MRLLLLGDTHGDFAWMQSKVIRYAKRVRADAVVQLGDFGFIWSCNQEDVNRTLGNLNRWFSEADMPLYWLDGNHENFEVMEFLGAKVDAPSMVQLHSHITYLPRGLVWEWGGVRFMSLGGAFSVDVSHRIPFISWWPQETITYGDVERALRNGGGGVDVLLTHDSPNYSDLSAILRQFNLSYNLEHQSMANRHALDGVVDELNPRLAVHAHYHHRLVGKRGDTSILGLNHSKTGSLAWKILDTDALDEEIARLRS